MSGTSSTQPGPTESAPLTPEQRRVYEEIGAALAAGDRTATSVEEWRSANFPPPDEPEDAPLVRKPAAVKKADERVAELMQAVTKACSASCSVGMAAALNRDQLAAAYVEESAALAAVESSARALLAAGREDADADLFKLLDIAAHHFTEGHYGWPSTDTRAAILAHWRAGKPPVPSVFDAELLQAINDPNRDEGTP